MGLLSRVRNVFRGDVLNRELDEEFNTHIEEAVAAGRDRAEAKRAFGPMLRQREKSREFLVAEWMETLLQDLRYGTRVLVGSPLFTFVAVASLALGIGANTAIFAVAKTVLLDTLPVKDPRELRLLYWTSGADNRAPLVWGDANRTDGRVSSTSYSYPVFAELRKDTDAVADLFGFKNVQVTLTAQGDASIVDAEFLSGNAFAALGVVPEAGRLLSPSDDNGTSAVAVMSDAYWAARFGRSPSVVGQVIAVNGVPVTIIGVAQERFEGLQTGSSARLFLPVTMQPVLLPRAQVGSVSLLNNPQSWWLLVMARVKPGVSEEQAKQRLDARMQHAMAGVTLDGGVVPELHLGWQEGDRGLDYLKDALEKPSYILLTLAVVVVLLACVNLANLLLARATAREREMSTRLALGAGRMRLVRQMVTESLLLSSLGGVAGLLLGYFGRNVIPHLLAKRDVEQMTIAFDWRILLFTAVVSVSTGVLFGVFPAWQATRTTLGTALKDAGQGTTNRRTLSVGKVLVVVQIGLSAVLLIGAGLFVRTLENLMHRSLGFQADHLVLFHMKPPQTRYDSARARVFYARMEEKLSALPGVKSVAVSTIALVGDGGSGSTFRVMGRAAENSAGRVAATAQKRIQMNLVGQDYFPTMGVGIVRGRGFDQSDTATSPRVAVVNQTLVDTYFPNEDPIGQMFLSEDSDTPVRIVGVSADTSYSNLRAKTPSLFYLRYEQYPEIGSMAVMVRTQVDPMSMAAAIRQAIAGIDPDLPVVDLRTMEDQIDTSLTSERTFARLTTGFGVIALLLAMVGIYGIMAYTVARRTNEIGLRMALGAQTNEVMGMMLGEAGWLAVCGIGLGTLGAVALVRSVETMLYGLKPFDPLTLLGTAVLLGTITVVAAFGPAWRAAHIDPLRALRHE